jgi:hypothetical protein
MTLWFSPVMKRIPYERVKQQNEKCFRLGLIKPVHRRQTLLQATAHAP